MEHQPHAVSRRKQDHLDLCLNREVESSLGPGWDAIQLPHRALPEVDFEEIDLGAELFGVRFSAPLLISSMTGGSVQGEALNLRLVAFADEKKIPMGVGSQRVALEDRAAGFFRKLRKAAPNATLFANLGAVQLNYGVTTDACRRLIDDLEAQGLILHCNPLQEAIQPEGNRNFSQLLDRIEKLRTKLAVPVILKETGCGIDPATARRAVEAGIDAIDVAGRGGSHWGFIEGLRSPARRELGDLFRGWGTGSAEATRQCVEAVEGRVPVIASGGIRSGLDIARALFLGASFCGIALPFLKAAAEGEAALEDVWRLYTEALRIALFCQGVTRAVPCGSPG